MRILLLFVCFQISLKSSAQELFVFTEPASNMPAKSIGIRLMNSFMGNSDKTINYHVMPEVMVGVNKKLMLHGQSFLSNRNNGLVAEGASFYAKYRWLTVEDVHRHFRMAAFVDGSLSRVPFHYEEISLMGDKTGIETGLIATQLWHKLAVSTTVSRTEILDKSRNDGQVYFPARQYQSVNYSLSAGYLLFPRAYKSYDQPNLNLYVEFLGQRLIGTGFRYADLAPALQLILNSNTKINVGKRFQLSGNMQRMARQSWLISIERSFLQAWR